MIKEQQIYPKCLELCNISSLWKKKGSRNEFDHYRGIFRVTIFRSILDRLIYNDEIGNIDKHLIDCNVGARKHRNIRDNIFVMNAIKNTISKEKKETVDFQIYDIEKCFDKLWLHEVINCLYEAGLRNDKLPLLFLENVNAQVAVKSNEELSRRIDIKELIMQGSVWGSISCVVLMEKMGKLAYKTPEILYYYKNLVGIPPLQMVDDVLGIQRCSAKSSQLNSMINTFMDLEKLKLSKTKCHNIHIGNQKQECPTLLIDGVKMDNSKQEIYLGDVIDDSGKAKINIEKRKGKGLGAVNEILVITNEVPLAHWKLVAGLRLRQAMLINGIMHNSETWHDIDDKDIIPWEKVDEALLRGLLSAQAKTPIEALYLETNSLPIRFILKIRRIMYLQNILRKDETEMIRKIYETQKINPSPGDFYKIVTKDMTDVGLMLSENEISRMSKDRFKNIVKTKVRSSAFQYLLGLKQTHSKMSGITYRKYQLQEYLISPMFNNENRNLLFRLRTRTVSGVRDDFKGVYPDTSCPLGCGDTDTLRNILTCKPVISQHKSSEISRGNICYEDIFSEDILKQKQVTELYRQLLHIRSEMLSQPVATTGPMHSSNTLQSISFDVAYGN